MGRCRGSFPRWYYDPTEQLCKSFVYGGCLGNKNNYLREEECKLACRSVQGEPLWGSLGAQSGVFPRAGGLSSPIREVSMRVPHSPAPPSAHPCWGLALPPLTSVFSFPGPSMARHNPGGLCSFPYSPHPCQVSSPFHVHAPDQAAFAQPIRTFKVCGRTQAPHLLQLSILLLGSAQFVYRRFMGSGG